MLTKGQAQKLADSLWTKNAMEQFVLGSKDELAAASGRLRPVLHVSHLGYKPMSAISQWHVGKLEIQALLDAIYEGE